MSLIPLKIALTDEWLDITSDLFNLFNDGESVEIINEVTESLPFEVLIDITGSAVIDPSFNDKGIKVDVYFNQTNTTLNDNYKYYVRSLTTIATITIKKQSSTPTTGLTIDELYDSGVVGLFNRLRVAESKKLFDNQLQYDGQPLFWDEKIVSGGNTLLDSNNSAIDLSVTTNGDKVVRQLKEYEPYESGNAQAINATYTPDENTNEVSFILRSSSGAFDGSVEGTPFDLEIPQSEWNVDKLDGTGISGITLDKTKSNILVVSLEWLSVGTVLYGFEIEGRLVLAHAQHNANKIRGVYMTTANLPARYEIEAVSDGAEQYIGYGDDNNGVFVKYKSPNQNATLQQICTALFSEGGSKEEIGIPYSPSSNGTPITLAAGATVYLAARHLLQYKGQDNRVKFVPTGYTLGSSDEKLYARIVYDPTIVGGTWAQYVEASGDLSAMEINSTITSISGGKQIDNKFIYATSTNQAIFSQGTVTKLISKLPFGIGIDADTPIPLVLEVTNQGTGTTLVDYGLDWIEIK
jgi:hypothetical protein